MWRELGVGLAALLILGFLAIFAWCYIALSASSNPAVACDPSQRPFRFTTETGSIESPNYSRKYSNNADCTWLVSAPAKKSVYIRFTYFSTQANRDFVNIYDGNSTSSRLIVQLSGYTSYTYNYTTTQPYLLLRFTSDNNVTDTGFNATFWTGPSASDVACDPFLQPFNYSLETSIILSPNYPQNYHNNADCRWLISAAANRLIRLFVYYFATESGYDFLDIHEGNNISAPVIVTLSGVLSHTTSYTTIQHMLVRFTSNENVTAEGFNATYSRDSYVTCDRYSQPFNYSSESGVILSPNYPKYYPNNADCQYLVSAPKNWVVKIRFEYFNTQSGYDFVYIHDGSSTSAPLIARLSGRPSLSTVFLTTQCNMLMRFTSDGSNSYYGFNATFFTEPEVSFVACDYSLQPFNFHAETGTILSLNFPQNYHNNADCQWLISTLPDRLIRLFVYYFATESGYDFLDIHEGNNISAPVIVTLSGVLSHTTSYTTIQHMLVRFTSNENVTAEGFNATYSSDSYVTCDRYSQPFNYSSESGVILSPNYPKYYPNNADCQYLVSAQESWVVQIKFEYFNTQSGNDFVYIHNGSSTSAPLIARLSGRPSLSTVFSTTQCNMLMRFTSDGSNSYYGFNATFWTSPEVPTIACDRYQQPYNYNTETGVILSPNYPANYPHNADCRWLVTAPQNKLVKICFTDFTTQSNYDYVYIYDGISTSSAQIAKLSGSPQLNNYTTSQINMLLRFTSSSKTAYQGFNATFWTIPVV